MCNNFPNIRITEGNNFSLVLPLRSRTYVATNPIDEDIDPEQLENVVVTFGGVEYPAQRTAQGVQIDLPATLAVGTYNILLTAEYLESSIRAAYESAVTIVPWSAQSTAEQYITGSPIVLRAAYVLSCVLTDAELEALKEEAREKIAEAEQAKADAEAAKEHYDQLAEEISGVAQEQTLTQGISDIREDISHINIDTTNLAKQGTNPNATNTAIFEAVNTIGADQATIAECYDICEAKGLVMPQHKTLANLPSVLETITKDYQGRAYIALIDSRTIANSLDYQYMDFTGAVFTASMSSFLYSHNYLVEALGISGTPTSINAMMHSCANLKVADLVNVTGERIGDTTSFEYGSPKLRSLIGYRTLDDVLNNDISVFKGIKYSYRIYSNLYDRATLRALINGLADLTGGTAQTLTMSATNLAKLTAEDIAIATAKNWTLA